MKDKIQEKGKALGIFIGKNKSIERMEAELQEHIKKLGEPTDTGADTDYSIDELLNMQLPIETSGVPGEPVLLITGKKEEEIAEQSLKDWCRTNLYSYEVIKSIVNKPWLTHDGLSIRSK